MQTGQARAGLSFALVAIFIVYKIMFREGSRQFILNCDIIFRGGLQWLKHDGTYL